MKIDRDMIGAVIGPGGKVVQEIQRETGATVVIEETERRRFGQHLCFWQGASWTVRTIG